MKRNRIVLVVYALVAMGANIYAQTTYEAVNLMSTDLNGTSRFVGMGGAMSALGADISTMGTNPAGIGLYRSWDVALSASVNNAASNTDFGGDKRRADDFYGAFDQVGMVIANKQSNEDALRFVNYGFNFRNVKKFNSRMAMRGELGGLSQTGQMVTQALDNPNVLPTDFDESFEGENFFNTNFYKDSGFGWLTLLGADARLIDGRLYGGEFDGETYPKGFYYPSEYCEYQEVVSGGIDAWDFNLSFNFYDAVYLGVTLTTYDVDYRMESVYSELILGGDYTLQSFYNTVGTGYDFKLGVILRPFVESSFRLGVSVTTPTQYRLTDYNSAIISSNITYEGLDEKGEEIEWTESVYMDTHSEQAFNGDCMTEYSVSTPAKFNVSMGGTIGNSFALGAEYEYVDYANTRFYYDDGFENEVMNSHTQETMDGHHTFRIGMEKMFPGAFYARLGYNYMTGGYSGDAWKMIPVNSVQTNTAYANILSINNLTCGVGYRGDTFYADAALLYSKQLADFYPFDNLALKATSLTRDMWKGMVTVGLRF